MGEIWKEREQKMEKSFLTLDLSEIKPYENNPRFNDAAVKDVIESIKQCGNCDPIEVDECNVILSGHTRYKALTELGYKETDVIRYTGLTEEQKKKYRLLANKTAEKAQWDFEKLEIELSEIDFDGYDFGFDAVSVNVDDFEEDFTKHKNDFQKTFEEKMEAADEMKETEEYKEFLEKFKAKKTTDDCYTPPNIYDAVAEWVESEYKVKRENFIRPFYPGGNYKKEKYPGNCIVVDNPPFSILSEILDFYIQNNIKFFIFCNALTAFSNSSMNITVINTGIGLVYENGANVSTSFYTNLDDENIRAKTAPKLYKALKMINKSNQKELTKELPKYTYPDNVITSTRLSYICKYGIDFKVTKKESERITQLDSQKKDGKVLFGSGYLVSDRLAAEIKAAEIKAAEIKAAEIKAAEIKAAKIWELSENEKNIIKKLNQGGADE